MVSHPKFTKGYTARRRCSEIKLRQTDGKISISYCFQTRWFLALVSPILPFTQNLLKLHHFAHISGFKTWFLWTDMGRRLWSHPRRPDVIAWFKRARKLRRILPSRTAAGFSSSSRGNRSQRITAYRRKHTKSAYEHHPRLSRSGLLNVPLNRGTNNQSASEGSS